MPIRQGGLFRTVLSLGLATVAASGSHLLAESAPIPFVDAAPTTSATTTTRSGVVGVELLTETQGVDFGPYVRRFIQTISSDPRTAKTVPGSPDAPTTVLTVVINLDGKLVGLHLDESSHNRELDQAAWASIAQHKLLPPLPKNFEGSSLTLRVHLRAS